MAVSEAMSVLDLKPSKYDVIRELVSEKLTTAALEILAVVERTVSGYEEEAAALRREIDRQKKQLEAVLQPRVRLFRIEPARGDGLTGSELPQDETAQTKGEDSESRSDLKHKEEEDVEENEPENNENRAINLQVCLLQDAHADMLTRNVFKSSVQEVTCPPNLKEAEFLDLLRSTFPQLSAEFEVFTVDLTQKLTPLNLETVTPKNIEAAIESRENGRSALYIQVKEVEESKCSLKEEETQSEIKEEPMDVTTRDEQGSHGSSSSVPVERAESRQQQMEPQEDVQQEGISEDFSAPESAQCSAHEDDGKGDKEPRPDDTDKEMKSMEPKHKPPKTKKKKLPVVTRTRKNLKVSTENGPLFCKVCQALSGSKHMLIKHSWAHVDDPERLCGVCGERSDSPEELRNHLNNHKKQNACGVSGKAFQKPGKLTVRLRSHSKEKVKVCGKGLPSKKVLKSHLIIHTREKPHKCSVCRKTFKSPGSLSRHKKIHLGVKENVCSICGKAFKLKQTLKVHMSAHNSERPHKCLVCKKNFKSFSSISQHKKIHSGVKDNVCSICGKAFILKQTLEVHMSVHNSERPYKCSVCKKTFKSPCSLSHHKKIHLSAKAFKCSVCGKAFLRKDHLKCHMKIHNKERP